MVTMPCVDSTSIQMNVYNHGLCRRFDPPGLQETRRSLILPTIVVVKNLPSDGPKWIKAVGDFRTFKFHQVFFHWFGSFWLIFLETSQICPTSLMFFSKWTKHIPESVSDVHPMIESMKGHLPLKNSTQKHARPGDAKLMVTAKCFHTPNFCREWLRETIGGNWHCPNFSYWPGYTCPFKIT